MLKLGSKSISTLYLGGQEIKKAYLGEHLVFGPAPSPTYAITVSIDPSGGGTVTGAGQYQEGDTVTLLATPADGYEFSGWQEGGQTVSTSAAYTFTAAADRALTAVFAAIPQFNPTWTQVSLPLSYEWADMCYADGMFVAVGTTGKIIYSGTGTSWTAVLLTALSKTFRHIVHGNGVYCAFDSDTTRYSADGTSWYTNSSSPNNAKLGAAYGPDGFVLVAKGAYYISTNGYSHSYMGSCPAVNVDDMAYGDGKYVTLGLGSSGNTGWYYTWGGSWTQFTVPVTANWHRIIYAGGRFVAIATGSDNALCSEDGVNWEACKLPFSGSWNALAFGDGVYVALASGSDKVAYSTDGKIWKLAQNTLPDAWDNDALAYGDGKFVVVSYGVAAYTS